MKKTIRLSEQNLHRVIEESVKMALKEIYESTHYLDGEQVNENFLNYYPAAMDTLFHMGTYSRQGRHDRTRLGGKIANTYDNFKQRKRQYDKWDELDRERKKNDRNSGK